jgi:hypothetical protein
MLSVNLNPGMMKKLLLFTLAFVLFIASQAQNYQPINTQDTAGVWSIWDEKYFFLGDSAFDGHQYKKLWKIEDSIFSVAQRTYAGLFREDSTGKAWLCYPGVREKVLFDLNRNVGDTLRVVSLFSPNSPAAPFNSDSTITVVVLAVDSVMINGTAHRRLAIDNIPSSNQQHEYWIEGIGSTAGLPYSGQGNMVAVIWWSILLCYEENGQTIYADSSFFSSCYEVPTFSIDENSLLPLALKISPNPASTYLNIELSTGELLNTTATATLYNLAGQEVLRQELEISSGTGHIPLAEGARSLPAVRQGRITTGTYLLQLKTPTHVFVEKIVVQ